MSHDYTIGNEDNITEAVHGLDYFTKNWCMNCAETTKLNEPIFHDGRNARFLLEKIVSLNNSPILRNTTIPWITLVP